MTARRRVVITGSTGWLAQHLIRHLKTANSTLDLQLVSRSQNLCYNSVEDMRGVLERLSPDVILHLAALSSPAACEIDDAFSANAPEGLLQALVAYNNVPRASKGGVHIIFASTDMVYRGNSLEPTLGVYRESDSAEPETAYGQAKLFFEKRLMEEFGSKGSVTVLRFSNMLHYAGKFGKTLVDWLSERKEDSRFFLLSDSYRSFVAVEDVCEVVGRFLTKNTLNAGGIWNVGGPEALSRAELGRRMRKKFLQMKLPGSVPNEESIIEVKAEDMRKKMGYKVPLNLGMRSEKIEQELTFRFKNVEDILHSWHKMGAFDARNPTDLSESKRNLDCENEISFLK